MQRRQRRAHAVLWAVLLPLAAALLGLAVALRPAEPANGATLPAALAAAMAVAGGGATPP